MTTYHFKFQEARTLVEAAQPILLVGEKGSGKTTMAKQIAESLNLAFYNISMTRQTTLSHLLGFINVNGVYVPSHLRKAVEEGGMMLLDEIDAADANVLLTLNTVENGYVSFPDAMVECHPNFRLAATANPPDQHAHYTGRTKLDGSTLDRFDIIEIPRDDNLEKLLVDANTFQHMCILREVVKEQNSTLIVSMRDAKRYQKRKELNLLAGFIERMVGPNTAILERYYQKIESMPKHNSQSECTSFADLVDLVNIQSGVKPSDK